MGRMTTCPGFLGHSTARFLMACMPRMPDCGGLRMGVLMRLPYTPPLVMVNVPPVMSSTLRRPSRAFTASSLMPISICAMDMPCTLRTTGTTRPLSVPTATDTSM